TFEFFDSGFNSPASPAVCNTLGPFPFAHNCYPWDDIGTMQDGCVDGFKMMMLGQDRPMRFKHQGKSVVSVALRKSAIDCNCFAASFDRRFPLFNRHRYMPIHDQSVSRVRTEFLENFVTKPDFMNKAKIRVLGLVMRCLIDNEIAFEGCNAIF